MRPLQDAAKIKLPKRSACEAFTQQTFEVQIAKNQRMKKSTKQVQQEQLDTKGFEQLFLPVKQQPPEPVDSLLARPEMHMFLRPYFLLDKHADRMAGFETREIVTVNGKKIERHWCVTPDKEYGMPGPIERDVLLVVYSIAYECYLSKGSPIPEIMYIGSIRSFLNRLGLSCSGQNSAAVKLALKRLVHTTCKSENSFFDKSKNLFLTESFHLLRGVGIAGESDGKGGSIEETYVIFDERIRRNLTARYLMVIDLVLLRRFNSDIAKHLYPLLSHWLWRSFQQGYWRVEYHWLAEHLGIKIWDKLWRAKNQLKVANEELKNFDYIDDYKWEGWNLIYFPGAAFKKDQLRRSTAKENIDEETTAKHHTDNSSVDDHDPLLPILNLFAQGIPMADQLLKQRGLTQAQAQALCLEKGIQQSSIE